MFLLQQFLPGMVVAALLSGIFALVGRLWKTGNWADAVALAIGYSGGQAVTAGWPTFPPAEATQWLPYFALLAMCLGVVDVLVKPPPLVRAAVWIFFCAGFLRLLLQPKFQYGWSLFEGVIWIIALAVGMLCLASFLDGAIRNSGSISSILILLIVACGTGATLMLSGSMLLAQLAMVLGAAFGALLIAGLLLPRSAQARGVVGGSTLLLTGLWLSGYFYAELPSASALLLAAAPLPSLQWISRTEKSILSWKDFALYTGAAAILVLIAIFLALRASPPLDY